MLEYRARGRERSTAVRAALAGTGACLFLAPLPLVVVLPELGVPLLLFALRLLAVEVDWAAKAYAWVDWRFNEARDWFHRQAGPVHIAAILGLIAVAVALVWLLDHELG